MNNPNDVARITRWIKHEGRLEQFRLTLVVKATMRERERIVGGIRSSTNSKEVDGIRTGHSSVSALLKLTAPKTVNNLNS